MVIRVCADHVGGFIVNTFHGRGLYIEQFPMEVGTKRISQSNFTSNGYRAGYKIS